MLIDPRLILDWQKRPMTQREAEMLITFLDYIDGALKEAHLAYAMSENHFQVFEDRMRDAKAVKFDASE
jgi:hypothetical protein